MSEKNIINPSSLRLISEDEVPSKKNKRGVLWEEIFDNIPQGQAAMFRPEEVGIGSIRAALKRLQEKGKYKNLQVTGRKVGKRQYISYVINPSEEQK